MLQIYFTCVFVMKHAKADELRGMEELLDKVRSVEGIKEPAPNHFYYKGRGILHFHSDSCNIYADVFEERVLIVTMGNMSSEAMDKIYNLIKKNTEKQRT